MLEVPHVRSFAAAPLVTREGHHVGALRVFDREPRQLQPQDLENLTDLAVLMMRVLELRVSSRRRCSVATDGAHRSAERRSTGRHLLQAVRLWRHRSVAVRVVWVTRP